jgi:hypothetical protein
MASRRTSLVAGRAGIAALALLEVGACERMGDAQPPQEAFAAAVKDRPSPLEPHRSEQKGRFIAIEDLVGRTLDTLPSQACGPDDEMTQVRTVAAEAGGSAPRRESWRCLGFRGRHDAIDAQVSDLEGWVPAGSTVTMVVEGDPAEIVFVIATKAYPDRALAERVTAELISVLDGWDCDARETGVGALGVADCADGPGFAVAQMISSAADGGGAPEIHQVFLQVARDQTAAEAALPLLPAAP